MQDPRADLEARRRLHLYRERGVSDGPAGPRRRWNGREVLSFCGNDYLGLAADARVIEAGVRGLRRYGAGAGASCLVNGYTAAHRELEEGLAAFLSRERALLFASGYMANLGVVMTLAGRTSHLFEDRLNHASLLDAGVLSRARLRRYPHCDTAFLRTQLRGLDDCVVASDAVFSMDGDIAPLAELAALCTGAGALLVVDDAHGIGVLGDSGAGATELAGLGQREVPLLVGTLGKAFGVCGAFAAGGAEWIDALVQHARTYIYATAPPPALACAAAESLNLVRGEGWRRRKLLEHVALFRRLAGQAGLACLPSETPIQGVVTGGAEAALALSRALLDDGLHVAAIRPPTVPEGGARLRITLSAAHTPGEIERLVESLARQLRRGVGRVAEEVVKDAAGG